MPRPRAVLLDVDGTLTDGIGGPAIPGAVDALQRLARRVPFRYVTNCTSWSRAMLTAGLAREGFPLPEGALVTPTVLAQRVLVARGDDSGVLIAEPATLADLGWYRVTAPEEARSVLLASEAHELTIAELQPAVEALLAGARLYTLQQNRVFRRHGRLVTDLGPIAAFLGYAAGVGWENLGKPSPLLFAALAGDMECAPADLALVGDDAEFDAAGALRGGCGAGVLVRTGKYRPGDEAKAQPRPTLVAADVAEALAQLMQ